MTRHPALTSAWDQVGHRRRQRRIRERGRRRDRGVTRLNLIDTGKVKLSKKPVAAVKKHKKATASIAIAVKDGGGNVTSRAGR